MSEATAILIGRPQDFTRSADGQLYPTFIPGVGLVHLALDESGLYMQVGAVVAPSRRASDGTMGDWWNDNGEFVVAGTSGQPVTPAAPPGGWCFRTINGVLTAVACNATSSNTPQGTILSSSDTRAIQQALNSKINAGLAVDGNFGPKTAAAVRTFQSRNGLATTGVVDSQTRALLFAARAPVTTTPNAGAGAQPNFNQPPPSSGFSLSSLFSGIDSTTLLLVAGVAVVAIATRG